MPYVPLGAGPLRPEGQAKRVENRAAAQGLLQDMPRLRAELQDVDDSIAQFSRIIGAADAQRAADFFRIVTHQMRLNQSQAALLQTRIAGLRRDLAAARDRLAYLKTQRSTTEAVLDARQKTDSYEQGFIAALQTKQLLDQRARIQQNWDEIKRLRAAAMRVLQEEETPE